MRLPILLCCLFALSAAPALIACGAGPGRLQQEMAAVDAMDGVQPADLAGPWRGGVEMGPMTLRLELRLAQEAAGLSGALVSIDQGGARVALDEVSLEGARLRFLGAANGLSYEGVVGRDGRIVGMLTQRGQNFALTFERGAVETADAPEAIAAPAAGETETAVAAANASTGEALTLTGSLRQPDGARAGVVILSGSGPQDRDGRTADLRRLGRAAGGQRRRQPAPG